MIDWFQWHEAYSDPESDMSDRLKKVKDILKRTIDEYQTNLTIINIGAGQARETLDVLRDIDKKCNVFLLEQNQENCNYIKNNINGVDHEISILNVDAFDTSNYINIPRADIIILSGILGNMPLDNAYSIIDFIPSIIKAGGYVIWTKSIINNDLELLLKYMDDLLFKTEISIYADYPKTYTIHCSQFIGIEYSDEFNKKIDISFASTYDACDIIK